MEPFDTIKQICSRLITCPIGLVSDTLPLEHSEKYFAGRVITAMADSTHAARQRVVDQEALIIAASDIGCHDLNAVSLTSP